jgi:hypothetical protein
VLKLQSNLVCPRCGTAAEDRACPKCGLSLSGRQLPTRAAWERQVLTAAQEFGRQRKSEVERPHSSTRLWWVLPAAFSAVAVVVAAVLASSGDSPTARHTQRLAAGANLDVCAERWNREKTLRPDYARGVETAYVTLDAEGRCVIALPASAATRSGYATFVQVQGGPWASYANYPPVEETRAAYAKALADAKELERLAGETPNAGLRDTGTIILAD